eukprot:CAMPEP_0176356302 /NCGR_PEP_ID=MMETSP0126-20121128/13917_1 /TAXON_ID=141414 ORGANISM="Strombidinopsis acuminatum, Strain SPMC142" /NCGR_SAMPLE_ID=MMETSP0126 /ASSEMBLY_ACC=CAM_ASM_000229 /LENGTH=139 /DNA_ID=CAMNT_0017709333 /DNA_START=255 /DNA_END=674 /DNA_ORIENTATION=-
MYAWLDGGKNYSDDLYDVTYLSLNWAYIGYETFNSCRDERNNGYGHDDHGDDHDEEMDYEEEDVNEDDLNDFAAESEDGHSTIHYDKIAFNWYKVFEDLYEMDDYRKKEYYFSYGTNLTDAVAKAVIGFNYACDYCLFD